MIPKVLRVASPGLMMAGMAMGVSHLVQSTRAGAGFGFQLVFLVIAVNLAKYPFFEYAHRYAAATGESLLHGYLRLGRGALSAFMVIHIFTVFVGLAAIVFVTAALAENLFHLGLSTIVWSALLIAAAVALALAGRLSGLDVAIKVMLAVLIVASVLALSAAAWHGSVAPEDFPRPSPWQAAHLGFLIALMGWMPGAIDVSVFQSLWLVARNAATGHRISLADARFDFNLGYILSIVMAVVFLSLGALVMYGSGEEFAASSVGFASHFVDLYSRTLGEWIRPIVGAAALATMLSTVLAGIDAAPRALSTCQTLLQRRTVLSGERLRAVWTIVVGLGGFMIIIASRGHFIQLIDLVATMSFLAAPFFAYLNMRLIASEDLPDDARPGPVIRTLAVVGLLFLIGFGVLFLFVRLGGYGG